MAVATGVRHGDQGQVIITNSQTFVVFVVQVFKWDASWDNDYFPREVFADATKGHKYYRGMYDVTGSFEGHADGRAFGAGHDPGAASSANLYLMERGATPLVAASPIVLTATSLVLFGPAHINIRMSVDRRTGLNAYTGTFKSDGDWTETLTA